MIDYAYIEEIFSLCSLAELDACRPIGEISDFAHLFANSDTKEYDITYI